MKPAALLLIKDNAVVQRLIVAWPRVQRRHAIKAKLAKVWGAVAGVREIEVRTWMDMLFANEIVYRDGRVDSFAEAYVTRLALARIPRDLLKKPEKGEG